MKTELAVEGERVESQLATPARQRRSACILATLRHGTNSDAQIGAFCCIGRAIFARPAIFVWVTGVAAVYCCLPLPRPAFRVRSQSCACAASQMREELTP
jgi:hypothetical protein